MACYWTVIKELRMNILIFLLFIFFNRVSLLLVATMSDQISLLLNYAFRNHSQACAEGVTSVLNILYESVVNFKKNYTHTLWKCRKFKKKKLYMRKCYWDQETLQNLNAEVLKSLNTLGKCYKLKKKKIYTRRNATEVKKLIITSMQKS